MSALSNIARLAFCETENKYECFLRVVQLEIKLHKTVKLSLNLHVNVFFLLNISTTNINFEIRLLS